MNPDIMIGDFSENQSNIDEIDDKDSEIDDNDASQLMSRAEYSANRIAEITPKLSTILHGNTHTSKHFDKLEAILFEKIFKGLK